MAKNKALAIDLGGTNIRGAIVSDDGNMSNWFEGKIPDDKDRIKILESIFEVIDHLLESTDDKIVGIGLGITGLVSHDEGIIRTSPNISSWKNEPLKSEIEEKYSIQVIIDNDSNLAGYGEASYGAGKGASILVMLTLGTGLGGGIIIDGKIFRGKNNTAAEIGHMTIKSDGLKCKCGNIGCFEAYVSATGILKRTKNLLNTGAVSILTKNPEFDIDKLTTFDICKRASEGDKLSRKILDETGKYLGVGMSSLINLLNPEIIVIGGKIAYSPYDFIQTGIEEARKRTYGFETRMPLITKTKLEDRAGILGAGKLVFDHVGS